MTVFENLFLRSLVIHAGAQVDQGLRGTTGRQLVSSEEVQNYLLDIRSHLSQVLETLEAWEPDSACIPSLSGDGLEGEEEGA